MAKAKRKREQWTFLGWIVLLLILWALVLFNSPQFIQQVFGVANCEETCSDYFERRFRSRRSVTELSYFVLENGVSVRIPKSYLWNMGLSKDELNAAEGTECTVTYANFPFFDGAYPLIAISNGKDLSISEEVTTEKYQEHAKAGYIIASVITGFVMLFLLAPRIWKLVKKHQKEKRKQEKREKRQMVLAARQKAEIEKNLSLAKEPEHTQNK